MSHRLKENINSYYVHAANLLNSKKARHKIVAYVESYDDVFFWRTVLSQFEDDTRFFEVMLPSRINLTKGKKSVLMNFLGEKVGEAMIACVDADYDYLLQQTTPTSYKVNHNPYVFHTYVYAIENYQCYAPSLHDVCVSVTLNDHAIFDFEDYYERYSVACYPLFVWSVWLYRNNLYKDFTLMDFCKFVDPGGFNVYHPEYSLANLKQKVDRKVAQFQHHYPEAKQDYLSLKDELLQLGITPETTYLYIQGHHIFDNVTMPIMEKVCDILRHERETEIYHNAEHSTQMHNELSCYEHSIQDITAMLKKNVGYIRSKPYFHLIADIDNFLNIRFQKFKVSTELKSGCSGRNEDRHASTD
jgi:hypothetical protein